MLEYRQRLGRASVTTCQITFTGARSSATSVIRKYENVLIRNIGTRQRALTSKFVPRGVSTWTVFPNIHYPTDVMFYRRIITVTSLSFTRRSGIDRWFVLDHREESWNGSTSSTSAIFRFVVPTILFVLSFPFTGAFRRVRNLIWSKKRQSRVKELRYARWLLTKRVRKRGEKICT